MCKLPKCPRCGNRLFLESEFYRGGFVKFWACSVGCSREWGLDGLPRVRRVGERRIAPVAV